MFVFSVAEKHLNDIVPHGKSTVYMSANGEFCILGPVKHQNELYNVIVTLWEESALLMLLESPASLQKTKQKKSQNSKAKVHYTAKKHLHELQNTVCTNRLMRLYDERCSTRPVR